MILNKNKYVIGLIITLLVIGVALLIAQNIKTPIKYWFKEATSFAECKEASGFLLESYPEQCVFKKKSFSNPDQKIELPFGNEELRSYSDILNKYSFEYPTKTFNLTTELRPLPFYPNQKEQTAVLTHSIDARYCNLKGDCSPTTTDIEVSFVVLNVNLADLKKSKLNEFNPFEEIISNPQIPATYEVTFVETGVEGEGINYYFIPLSQGKTLAISRKYINENILASYQNNPDFIPFFKQGEIAINLIKTLSIDQ